MGQAFSSTVGTVLLDEDQTGGIDDIWDANAEYCFSDGCGVISSELARDVSKRLRLRYSENFPSAYQIRFGGAKGVLSCWDTMLPREEGVELKIRPSMVKFHSEHKAVEVVGYSKRFPLVLNRQIILLLSNLGIEDQVFLDMQRMTLRRLDNAMKADGAVSALHLLYSSGCGSPDGRLKSLSPMLDIASMFRAGLTCTNCEFLFDLMTCFRRRTLKMLTSKARIPLIDIDDGCSVIGVVDEIGVLEANEVFLQRSHPVTGDSKVLTGPCVCTRFPCLHPGDIQGLQAVDRDELAHLKDIIVFSQKGSRPVPSMLSGGGLFRSLDLSRVIASYKIPRVRKGSITAVLIVFLCPTVSCVCVCVCACAI